MVRKWRIQVGHHHPLCFTFNRVNHRLGQLPAICFIFFPNRDSMERVQTRKFFNRAILLIFMFHCHWEVCLPGIISQQATEHEPSAPSQKKICLTRKSGYLNLTPLIGEGDDYNPQRPSSQIDYSPLTNH